MAAIQGPFSLKDQCKFKILSCIHQYPLESLAKLPVRTRKLLCTVLSICDRLHFKGTSFLHGLEDMTNDPAIMPTNEAILDLLFKYSEPMTFIKLGALNFHSVIGSFDCFRPFSEAAIPYEGLIDFIELIQGLTTSSSHYARKKWVASQPEGNALATIKPIFTSHGYFAAQSGDNPDATPPLPSDFINKHRQAVDCVLFPLRHLDYFSVEERSIEPEDFDGSDHVKMTNFKVDLFIDYCRVTPPTSLLIDTSKFMFSAIWNSYESLQKAAIEKAFLNRHFVNKSRKGKQTIVTPCFPYLEKFLSLTEFLKIGTNDCSDFVTIHHYGECYVEIPYILLCNIVSKETTPLRSIHAYASTSEGGLQLFYTIAGFMCGEEYVNMTQFERIRRTSTRFGYLLSMKHFRLMSIESLAITRVPAKDDNVGYYQTTTPEPESMLATSVLQQACKASQSTLKALDITGINFVFKVGQAKSWKFNNEYVCFVSSFFVEFLRQPHFQLLALGELPENRCRELINAFLVTPTSHDQELRISIAPNRLQLESEAMAPSLPDPTQLPSTNDQHKSLILDSTCDDGVLTKQVVSLRTLNFKKLQIPIGSITSIHPDPNISISHVCLDFSFRLKQHRTAVEHSLGLFLRKNPSLTILEFAYDPNAIHSLFWSLASSALENVTCPPHSTAVLNEVRLHALIYYAADGKYTADGTTSHSTTSSTGYDFFNYTASLSNFKFSLLTVSSSKDSVADGSPVVGGKEHNDVVRFFSIVQKAKLPLSFYGEKHLFRDTNQPIVNTLIEQFRDDKLESIRFSEDSSSACTVSQNMIDSLKQITDNLIIERN